MNSPTARPNKTGPNEARPGKPGAGKNAPDAAAAAAAVSELAKRIIGNVEQAIVGKRKQLVLSMAAWLSGGHILLGRRTRCGQDDACPSNGS